MCVGRESGLNEAQNNPLADATMGMECAERNMEIPMVLHPSDMVGEPDELSNMVSIVFACGICCSANVLAQTYISYFRDYEEKRGQRDIEERIRRTPVAEQCRAYGPGLEHGEALIPGLFVVEARYVRPLLRALWPLADGPAAITAAS